jgi:hypothetical protein
MFGTILSAIGGVFSGGGAVEKIATEWIETNKEKAEAKALMVKTLDPNGKMRRDLSRFASAAYGFYLFCTTILLFMVAFEVGDSIGAEKAASMMTELFLPITTSWGAIVGASFGVNYTNVKHNK